MTEVPRIPKVLTNRFTIFYLPCSPVIHLDGSRNSTLFFNGTLVGHASGTCQQQITKRFGTLVHFLVHLYNFSFIYNYTYIYIYYRSYGLYRLYRSYRLYSHWTCWFPVPVYPDPGRRIRFRKKEAPGAVASTCTSVMDFCLRRCIDRHMYYIYIYIIYIIYIYT